MRSIQLELGDRLQEMQDLTRDARRAGGGADAATLQVLEERLRQLEDTVANPTNILSKVDQVN